MRKTEKSADMVWSQYLKQIKKVFRDLERFGLKFEEKVVSIAMIDATNLDSGTKLHIDSVARNMNDSKELEIKNVEESVRRLIISKVLEVKESEEDQDETTLWFKSNRFSGRGRNRNTGSIRRGFKRNASTAQRNPSRSYSRYQRRERG